MDPDVEQIIAVAQLSTELLGQAGNSLTFYMTITSGYLLVAYLIGMHLTRLQAVIITVLYVFLATLNTFAIALFYEGAFYFGDTYGAGRAPYWPIYVVTILLSLGILACLKFMWDVRHPNTE